jgi:hypothetical protein
MTTFVATAKYKSGASEDEFVKANREIVKLNGKVYSRSRLRLQYRRLQKIYDFFSKA